MQNTRVHQSYYLILLFCFVCLSNTTNCQPLFNVDSLKTQLVFQKDDTNKVKTLILLSKELIKSNPSEASDYSNQALELSGQLLYDAGVIDAFHQKSKLLKVFGSYDSAIYYCKQAIKISDSINDLIRYADNTTLLGTLIFRTVSPEAARFYYLKSLAIYNTINDSTGMAKSLNGIGSVLMKQGKYDSAAYYYLELIRISERIDYQKGLGMGYLNLGILYSDLNEFAKAELYLLKSITVNEELNNISYIALAFNNLGAVAYDKEEYNKALNYYTKSLEVYESVNNLLGIAHLNNNIGNVFQQKEDYNAAFQYYTVARKLYKKVGNKHGILIASKNQALIYERWKNYNKALLIYDSCLMIAQELNSIYRIQELYYNIFRTYELKGDYKNAFNYLTKHNETKDSIFNLKKTTTIADLQLKYEKEKDQALILSLENENLEKDLSLRKRTNQRNIYLFSGTGIIAVILFLFIFYRHKTRKDKIIAEQKIRQLEEEKKLLAAKSIVEGQEEERKRIAKELHDGLGVLLSTAKMQFTTIKNKSPENKPLIDKATKLLEQAAGDVRKISHKMMPGLLTRLGLYEAAEDLIEQLDETEGLSAKCEITGDTIRLPENTEIMLYRIFQEMVNNTLKHAEAKNIRLHMNIIPEQLSITYLDDGKGFNVEEKLESKSIGLTSIQSRVNFLSGQVNIESKPGEGVKYNMLIPI